MDPLILCENLVKIYPLNGVEIVALQGLDLAVERGEMLGIVGASGSGKSTLLNVLGGLDRPSAGKVLVAGKDLFQMAEDELDGYRRTQVGFVWQQTGRNLIPYLTALENVELPMRLSALQAAERRKRATELLDALGLSGRLHHHPPALSGGEQQRVAIGVALANRPSLLLADEPTGEVDTATAEDVFAALQQMNALYGMTTIIVSHDANIARHTHRVIAIRDGKTSTETTRATSPLSSIDPSQPQIMSNPSSPQRVGGDGGGGEHPPHFEELAVLDSAGRVQIPREYLEGLNIGDRVRLELGENMIAIHPVAGRGRNVQKTESEQPDLDSLYMDEDLAPEARRPARLAGLRRLVSNRWRRSSG